LYVGFDELAKVVGDYPPERVAGVRECPKPKF